MGLEPRLVPNLSTRPSTMPKTILIDGYNLGLEKGTGVATYARNLSYEIDELGHKVNVLYGNRGGTSRNNLLREIAFFNSSNDEPSGALELLAKVSHILPSPLGLKAVDVPITGKVIPRSFEARLPKFDRLYNCSSGFDRVQLAHYLWGKISSVTLPEQPDLAHWTYPLPLRAKRAPNIYTLHDIVPLRLPYTTLDNKKRYLSLIKRLDKVADHFVTVSECSKSDIVDIVGISPERITNTYQSVHIPAKYREKPEEQLVREVEGTIGVGHKEYFLYWGAIEPKKNIGRMIEAYLTSNIEAQLVIIGARAWKSKGELRYINDNNIVDRSGIKSNVSIGNRVVLLNYVTFEMLVSLIRGAKATLFPSIYEGFGLPVLEAMSLGTPVICSNASSLPEVAGDAAVMVDPYDTGSISAAIRTVDADSDLREELSRRGRVQAEKFSQQEYRSRLKALYDRFL